MKKRWLTFGLLLVTVLTLVGCSSKNSDNSSASAEEFVLHSGVRFGMSIDEVMDVEANEGYEITESSNGGFYDSIDNKSLRCTVPSLAGIGGKIYYHFSPSTEKLNMCLYAFKDGCTEADVRTLVEAYTKKDGHPFELSNEGIHELGGEARDGVDCFRDTYYFYDIVGETILNSFYQWICPFENGSVVEIMLLDMSVPSMVEEYPGYFREVKATYSYRTPEEIEAVTKKK